MFFYVSYLVFLKQKRENFSSFEAISSKFCGKQVKFVLFAYPEDIFIAI